MHNELLFGSPLDPNQVRRIAATHRGFLYQHLYGAACLLYFSKSKGDVLITEQDEDIELLWPDKRIYIQVKTRKDSLQWNDIAEAVDRFNILRAEHTEGRRSGTPHFVIITNAELGPELKARTQHGSWSADIDIQTPTTLDLNKDIPPAWSDLGQALEWCTEQAKGIPMLAVPPETLVWKLASRIQYAATGYNHHKITREEVPSLVEQLVIQLQHFPEAPLDYKPQLDEPNISSGEKLRLITGVSGSGKTSWASQSVLHSTELWTYFDVSDLPQSAVANSLARELAAQFLDGNSEVVAKVLAAGSGLEILRFIDKHLRSEGMRVNIVLDNAHLIDAEMISSVVGAAQHLKFILLAQPSPELHLIEGTFGIRVEELKGWSMDTIAAELANINCPIDARTAKRLLDLTLGLPLFVQNAAQVVAGAYHGDARSFCDEMENREQAQDTVQDLILKKTFQQVSPNALMLAGLLGLADIPLDRSEIESISAGNKKTISAWLRELNGYGIVKFSLNGGIKLHDIFRGLAKDQLFKESDEYILKTKLALVNVLEKSMPSGLGRFGLWLRLLAETDQVEVLVDLATVEWFHEMGDPKELKKVLESASQSSSLGVEERFWALDALTFWDTQDHLYENIPDRIKMMQMLAAEKGISLKAKTAAAMKSIVLMGFVKDIPGLETFFEQAMSLAAGDDNLQRIIRYNRAYAHFHAANYQEAREEIHSLILEYSWHLKLRFEDANLKSLEHILSIVSKIPTWRDDLKHFADCFDMLASIKKSLNERLALEQIHALKFYTITEAYSSAIRVGQDAVDQLVGIFEYQEARKTIENNLLPLIKEAQLVRYELQVRSQYAVVLSYCGEIAAARSEMARLKPYTTSQQQRNEIQRQSEIIEAVALGRLVLPKSVRELAKQNPPQRTRKIGRNEPCYCGSGKKFKNCHG